MKTTNNLPGLLQAFFTDYLMGEKGVSSHTIDSYRDTFCLLLRFIASQSKKAPSQLSIEDLAAPQIGSFLQYLEKERGVSARSRNVRLAAVRSFFRYASLHVPEQSALIQRVLAMPNKRYHRRPIAFLTREEIEALLAAPDRSTWGGRRDRALLLLMVQTGLRVSEVTKLCCEDIVLGTGAHVRCQGKGRKERCTPLRKETVTAMRHWLRQLNANPSDPLFPNARGGFLSVDGVEYLLAKHLVAARRRCASLKKKRVTPHVLRHSAAMALLEHGIDRAVIALWLGHESVDTTQMYFHASLKLKERALEKTTPFKTRSARYRPDDKVMAFLKNL
jgi:site-specific recombinase XerD